MILVNGVTKKYGSRLAVENLNFTVERGEVVGFLGPNGAGKTTTMKMITGYMVPTSGEIKIAGEDIFSDPIRIKKKIGYLPEIPPVYYDMYVEKYLYYVAYLKGCSKKEAREQVSSAIERAGLTEMRHRLIQNLSKGFKQRTGLAQALVGRPEILILDEPTAGLDPNQIIEIRSLITQLKGQHTIILSTHILSEAQAVCDRVLIIKEGKMVAQESLTSLRERKSQSRRTIFVTVREAKEPLIKSLKQLKGIQSVRLSQGSRLSLVVQEGADSELNEQVVKKVIAQKAGLIELTESSSLEDMFLKLTSDKSVHKKEE